MDPKRTQSPQKAHGIQAKPDSMSALQFLHEEGAVRNVDVKKLTAFWESKNMQLSLARDGDDVQAGLLKLPDKEYDSRQTEESKSRLHFLVYKKSSLLSLQQESIDHLHRLLCKCSADYQTLPAESRNCKEKLWQLQAIEEQLNALQLTKDQVLPIYLRVLRGMVPNMLTAPSRLIMMHKSNDSVWLLGDGLDLLLPEILNVLLQQQTRGDIANQCPADKQEEVKLLKKFTSRLEVWQESLDKQHCLHRKLSNMFLHWPQYPWQEEENKFQHHMQVRRSQSTSQLDAVIRPENTNSSPSKQHFFFEPIMRRVKSQDQFCQMLQLPIVDDNDDVQADILMDLDGEYHIRLTEDSKSRLQRLLDDKSFRVKLQQESTDQLHQLLCEYRANPGNLHDEVLQSNNSEQKLWQLQGIEEQLQALQLTEDQIIELLHTYTTWLWDMGPGAIGDDMPTVAYRLKMMHERNDSVWLLHGGLDWLLPEVQTVLLLQQTCGDVTNQCLPDVLEEVQLLNKFTSRLEVWKENLYKQRCLHSKLFDMFLCWPQYPRLSLVEDADDVQADPLKLPEEEYDKWQTEDSKSRLCLLGTKRLIQFSIQQESADHLRQLLYKCSANYPTLPDKAISKEKLRQLQGIEEQLKSLQFTKDQVTQLIPIYTTRLRGMVPDISTVSQRLKMMHDSNDAVWLLHDELDCVLPEVQTVLLLQQTSGDTTNQCQPDQLGEVQLLKKFTSRLEVWSECLDKQHPLHSSINVMGLCWPQYPRQQDVNASGGYKHRRRTKSTSHLDMLPIGDDGDDVRADLLGELDGKYHIRPAEDSKSRLRLLLINKTFKTKIQKESTDQLHRLLCKYSANDETLHGEVPQSSDCEEKLWQLKGIDEQLQALHLTNDQMTQLLHTYTTWLRDLVTDAIGDDMLTVAYRLSMMHKTNDSVWLLRDGLDWLLPEVQTVLLLQQTSGDITNQCPAAEQEEVQLLQTFTSRLEDWRESIDKLQSLHRKLSDMLLSWPQYPWQDENKSPGYMHIRRSQSTSQLNAQQDAIKFHGHMHMRRTKSTCQLDMVIHPEKNNSSATKLCFFKPIMRRAKSQDQLCQMPLYEMIIEVVFPSCAMYLMPDDDACYKEATLSALKSGEAHRMSLVGILHAGSMAEGLTVENQWGHPWPDKDMMVLRGTILAVTIPGHQVPSSDHSQASTPTPLTGLQSFIEHVRSQSGSAPYRSFTDNAIETSQLIQTLLSSVPAGLFNSCLEYAPEGCPLAYTRLRVTNAKPLRLHPLVGADCIEEEDGHYWINTRRLNERLQRAFNQIRPTSFRFNTPDLHITDVSGPAGQLAPNNGFPMDNVPTLVANGPHPAMKDYLQRPRREWPPQEQLDEIQQMPMVLVLVGSKESQNPDKEARNSWSTGEMLLISKLPKIVKKGLIAAKFTFKYCVKIHRNRNAAGDGRSHIGSYHLKTTLLNLLEKTPPSKFNSATSVMMNVLQDLSMYLKRGNLPHYFLPECNLLATVGCNERQIALRAIQDIGCCPIATILKCPSSPTEIYGDICPEELVAAFRRISTNPCSDHGWENLAQLLTRLDHWRQYRYSGLLGADGYYSVSNRPGLTMLVDMLAAWKKEYT